MSTGPPRDDAHPARVPSPAEAARTLRELDAIGGRSRRIAYGKATRLPLVAWGVAWILGYGALGALPWSLALPVGGGLCAAAVLVTWLSRSNDQVVNGWERRIRLSWLVLMASSPLLVATITPAPTHAVLTLLGALWGVALLLYAVASADGWLGVAGAAIVVTAAAVHVAGVTQDLLVFGAIAGGTMTALGLRRMRMPG